MVCWFVVITSIPSLETLLCTLGFTLWVTYCYQDHFTKQNPSEHKWSAWSHTSKKWWLRCSDCRPYGLSTRQCCQPRSHTAREIFPILIMDCKFERVITPCYLPAALGSREPGKCSPILTPVSAVCLILSCNLLRLHFPVYKIRSNKTFYLSGKRVLRTH